MLVDKYDSNIVSFVSKVGKSLLDGRILRFRIDHKEILLGLRRRCDVLRRGYSAFDSR